MSRFVLEDQAPASPSRFVMEDAPARDKFDLRGEGYDRIMNYSPVDSLSGSLRGLASLGATVIRPFESKEANQERRAKLDRLPELTGANPNSSAYKTGEIVAPAVATLPIGGLLGKGIGMIPGAAKALPNLLPAIESGGMLANGAKGLYGWLTRTAGATVNGAATAGMVNPEDAGTGAMIGAATPAAVKLVGTAGKAIGSALSAQPINPVLQQTADEAVRAGYVIPPNMVAPSLKSQVLESVAGKQATQQVASVKNAAVTEDLVRKELGIAPDIPLSKATLENLRRSAGTAYSDVAALSPQAAADLEALKAARADAQSWFKAYNRSAHPNDLAEAKRLRAVSDQLETALEQHAAAANQLDLIPKLRDARKEIAKTFTVERALNDAAGTVDARVFGRLYEKGSPLSGGLETAGKFASAFPTVAKTPQQIGSPAAHNLKAFGSLLTGAGGYAAMGPLGAAAAAVPFVAPPVARSIMFSGPVQRSLAATPSQDVGLLQLLADETLPTIYRGSGLLATSP